MKRILLSLFLNLLFVVVFSQSKVELIKMGDAAYSRENYASAAYFYKRVVTEFNSDESDPVFPYQLKTYIKPEDSSRFLVDTTLVDTLHHKYDIADLDSVLRKKQNIPAQSSSLEMISENTEQWLRIFEMLASSYWLDHDYVKAEHWYLKLLEESPDKYGFSKYWYGTALLHNSKYDSAASVLIDFIDEREDTSSTYFQLAKRDVERCYYAKLARSSANPNVEVEQAGMEFNKGLSNLAAGYFPEGGDMIFTSSREEGKEYYRSGKSLRGHQQDADLYKYSPSINKVVNIGSPVNTSDHEGAAVISPDGNLLFYTRWNREGEEWAIYMSKKVQGQWVMPQKLDENINQPGFKTMHPAISPDGSTLYFSSNRHGGIGGFDLWSCSIDEFGNTGEVENLGNNVNTKGDEVSPYFHGLTGSFYFSSNGHMGMGGFDIYKTYPDNEFGAPVEHMGFPVNSSRDDKFFVFGEDNETGYLSSDRDYCDECDAGGCYNIYKVQMEPVVVSISGYVYDEETGDPIPNSLVLFKDIKDQIEPLHALSNSEGFYELELRRNLQYFVSAQKSKYFKDAATVVTFDIIETTALNEDFNLRPIPPGEIEIPGIEYDYNKATLRPESKSVLDELVEFLELNNNLVIEISSHTDERGSADYNQKLSEARAQSVVKYLTTHGIENERMVAVGYGEENLLVEGAETEEDHQKNRRTAFKILSEEYESSQE